MNPKKLTIIFICYNCGEDIAKNIIDVNNMALENYAIDFIVFDNASADNSLTAIEKINLPNLKIIANPSNLGFGKACNAGLKNANGDYYLLLNPDIELSQNSIRTKTLEKTSVNEFRVSCLIKSKNGSNRPKRIMGLSRY